jgi:hypothetical protein
VWAGHTGAVYAVCALPQPDGTTLLATASGDKTVLVWELQRFQFSELA